MLNSKGGDGLSTVNLSQTIGSGAASQISGGGLNGKKLQTTSSFSISKADLGIETSS